VVKTLVAECKAGNQRVTLKGTDPQIIILSANPTAADKAMVRTSAGRRFNASPVTASPFTGTCEIPSDLDLTKSRVFLEVDELTPEAAASVNVNGQPAGGFIGKPLRLEVTRFLKPGPNTLRLDPFAPKSARLVVY